MIVAERLLRGCTQRLALRWIGRPCHSRAGGERRQNGFEKKVGEECFALHLLGKEQGTGERLALAQGQTVGREGEPRRR